MIRYRMAARALTVALALCLGLPGSAGTYSAAGAGAVFNVTLTAMTGELAVGDFVAFELTLTDASGTAVTGATVVFSGGMPGHGHGFPTAPAVTEIGGGLYKLEGVKFSMIGAWEMTFDITDGARTDTVTLTLEI